MNKWTDDPDYLTDEEEAENEREYPAGPVTEEDVMDADLREGSLREARRPAGAPSR